MKITLHENKTRKPLIFKTKKYRSNYAVFPLMFIREMFEFRKTVKDAQGDGKRFDSICLFCRNIRLDYIQSTFIN